MKDSECSSELGRYASCFGAVRPTTSGDGGGQGIHYFSANVGRRIKDAFYSVPKRRLAYMDKNAGVNRFGGEHRTLREYA